ncbi:peptidase family M1-domain-containing protein [Tricharina praecox]|uniref:peptidase family M1-domain-containing protein n=1 Tax=Tricharina praecox TaxID=43433 RepID=UPI00221EA9EC|nr:peptidase family M1-domain-containing protein [Tricharina praecox]KAI5841250.1 peptidase family M1-domain-containing protein [Tricharina praecox]
MASDRDILPSHVKPTHYGLDLTNLDRSSFTYDGTVTISLELKQATRTISINSKQLTLHSGSVYLDSSKSTVAVTDISYDKKTEIAQLTLAEEIPNEGTASFTIKFSGALNHEMAGFYRSAYKNGGKDDWMYSTQFESCDARRAFPCFDEPNLKATFDFSIEIPESYTALSNQPEKESKDLGNGLKKVTFVTAPKMSTYLYAWACGEFEYVESFTEREYEGRGKLPVRVYTTKGLAEQGRFALENACKIVDYFSEIFKIDYPLPKVDLLAVHEFMENWGLITYRTTAVLFDEKTSDARYKTRVAYVVAHELAHQWFGNLVTMDWWSELWLNEGFATWVGWLATDKFHPEWDVWGQFVTESLQTAFQLDGLRGSHPIEVEVRSALEIDQIFDHISYLKGCSTIRMLSSHLGVETFLNGVSNYLKKHAYGNATTEDLWTALGEEAGADVAGFMRNWIKTIGFPVLTVTEAPGQITVKQSRFLSTGDVKPEEDSTTWWIPLFLNDEAYTSSAEKVAALTAKESTIKNLNTSHYKLNHGQNGFYRVNYPSSRLTQLGADRHTLSVSDRVGLIADAAAMAFSGAGSTAGLLSFLHALSDEQSYQVWSEILSQLNKLRSLFAESSPRIRDGLTQFTLSLISPTVAKLGWEFSAGEDFLTGRLRALLLSTAGTCGHAAVIAEAQRRFAAYTSGDTSLVHPSLRLAIFRTAVGTGGAVAVTAVLAEYARTAAIDGQEICLSSLGRVREPALIRQVLEFTLSDKVKVQDKHTPAIALSNNSEARGALWRFIQENWDEVYKQLSGNMVVLDRLSEIEEFFRKKDNTGYDKGLGVVKDNIRGNAAYVERDAREVEKWLGEHGY